MGAGRMTEIARAPGDSRYLRLIVASLLSLPSPRPRPPDILRAAWPASGHVPVSRLERQPGRRPVEQAARHVVGVEPGASKRLGRHGRAAPAAAVEHHGPAPIDRLDLSRQLGELDQPTTRDPPRVVLLGLADVDQLDLAALHQLEDLLRRVVAHGFHLIEQPTGWVSDRGGASPASTASRAS